MLGLSFIFSPCLQHLKTIQGYSTVLCTHSASNWRQCSVDLPQSLPQLSSHRSGKVKISQRSQRGSMEALCVNGRSGIIWRLLGSSPDIFISVTFRLWIQMLNIAVNSVLILCHYNVSPHPATYHTNGPMQSIVWNQPDDLQTTGKSTTLKQFNQLFNIQ